jgi:hypothetical protein
MLLENEGFSSYNDGNDDYRRLNNLCLHLDIRLHFVGLHSFMFSSQVALAGQANDDLNKIRCYSSVKGDISPISKSRIAK